MRSKSDWNQFKLRVNIRTGAEDAYRLWATPNGLESWFLRKALFKDTNGNIRPGDSFIQKDDTYQWYWHGYPDEVLGEGTVLETSDNKRFAFTFSLKCPVTISIYTEFDETIVELVESNLPADEQTIKRHFIGDSRGWIFYLANLKSVLEGGLDLRNKREELTNVITA